MNNRQTSEAWKIKKRNDVPRHRQQETLLCKNTYAASQRIADAVATTALAHAVLETAVITFAAFTFVAVPALLIDWLVG